jgi:hypothetical protein
MRFPVVELIYSTFDNGIPKTVWGFPIRDGSMRLGDLDGQRPAFDNSIRALWGASCPRQGNPPTHVS